MTKIINKHSDTISISGIDGVWDVKESKHYGDVELFLLQDSYFGDTTPMIIVDKRGNLIQSCIHEGFEELEEFELDDFHFDDIDIDEDVFDFL